MRLTIPSSKVMVLSCLSDSTSIMRLRLNGSGGPLSDDCLSNIGAAPASLKYVTWDVLKAPDWTHRLQSYRLESREGKTIAIPAELPYPWTTILDFGKLTGS